ncbi:hypothetical protein [Pseudanabaena sp. 'Roaring Creek']|uniref:hypothetical protein n=2 Tax=Pseudanabaena sp. 'Roaring Creek' TaxID=1681830 RepID=UPI0006D7EA4B|nr:hypothetical protein [Pseudanabaena sp. 'Roaring Creek']
MPEEFSPYLINSRSSALINFIDASQFSESEIVDVYLGICDRLKHIIELKPTIGFSIPKVPISIEEDEPLPTREELQEGFKAYSQECQSEEELLFKILPLEASMLFGLIQSAIINLETSQNVENFGRAFTNAFCDRHRENFPALCEAIKLGWRKELQLTHEEFDELLDLNEDEWEDDFA